MRPDVNKKSLETSLDKITDELERPIFILSIKWGLDEAEIADVFNLPESRIRDILRDIFNRLSLP
jgi:DNA-directed RNA polymerase sigma subunit (sigma70/sigma32)